MEEFLEDEYYNTKNPSSFTSLRSVLKLFKEKFPNSDQNFVENWLVKQETYSLHKSSRKKFIRSKFISK
jgi:hypothetical protein